MKTIMHYIKQNKIVIYLFYIGLFGYLSKYLLNITLAHYLSPYMLGQFNVGMRVLWITSALTLLGTNSAAVRFLSFYINQNDMVNINNYIFWNIKIIRIPLLLCIVLAVVSFTAMTIMDQWHVKEIHSYHIVVYMLVISPLYSFILLFGSYLFCLNKALLNLFIQNMIYLLFTLFFMLFAVLLSLKTNSYLMAIIIFYGLLIAFAIEVIYIRYNNPAIFNSIVFAWKGKNTQPALPAWTKLSIYQLFNGILSSLIIAIDLIIIECMHSNADQVGTYVVALTIASVLLMSPRSIYYLLKSNVFELISSEKGKKQIENQVCQLNRIVALITLILVVTIVLFAKNLLLHFGPIYLQGEPTLFILLLGYAISVFSLPATSIIAYSGLESSLLKLSVIQFLIILVLGIVLTYLFGIVGTASATTCAVVFMTISSHLTLYRKTKVRAYILW